MRLAQLARKVGRNQSEIVKFLITHGIDVGEESNAKVNDEDVKLVLQNYAPNLLQSLEAIEDVGKKDNEANIVSAGIVEDEKVQEHFFQENSLLSADEISDGVDLAAEEKGDLIKAPKIELPGLRVLGKIDLPEVKKKIVDKESASLPQSKITNNSLDNKQSSRRAYKNPIALQREREEEEKRKLKEERAAYEKEIRTQRYLNKVRRPTEVYKEPKEKVSPVKAVATAKTKSPDSLLSRLFNLIFKK